MIIFYGIEKKGENLVETPLFEVEEKQFENQDLFIKIGGLFEKFKTANIKKSYVFKVISETEKTLENKTLEKATLEDIHKYVSDDLQKQLDNEKQDVLLLN